MNDDNNDNNQPKYLIFLAGPTGAGKSKVKETVLKYLVINIGTKPGEKNYNTHIGVDDFFETNDTAKQVFKTIYDHYKKLHLIPTLRILVTIRSQKHNTMNISS